MGHFAQTSSSQCCLDIWSTYRPIYGSPYIPPRAGEIALLPTFVIGLREGLEAALIVGIVAAFLGQQGRRDALRQVWIGTAAAVGICIAIAIVLQVVPSDLPQRQQEGLETAVGALAVGMVTYMIIFMRGHARDLK